MKAIELFAGIGGFRVGLERAGHKVIWANEWDGFACDVYDKNYEEDKIDRRDITTIPAGDIPAHDIITAGFPCQNFSIAGKRQGFETTRGTLFFDIMRIARHHRTPYLFLENVKGLLSHDSGRTFATIITTMDELGYDCQWQVINSKDFGVPQNRERIIIVGHLRGFTRPEIFPIFGDGENGTESQEDTKGILASTLTARQYANWNGNFVKIVQTPRGNNKGGFHDIAPTLSSSSYQHNNHLVQPLIIDGKAKGSKTRRGLVKEGYTGALDTSPMQLVNGVRRLTPIECERLQAFPDNWSKYGLKSDGTVYEVSDTQRYKMCGNAVTTNVIYAVAKRLAIDISTC